jgi:hypothetical protein
MDIIKDCVFSTKYNQVQHEVEIYLDNGSDEKYPINPNSIVNLSIEDTLSDWVERGTMTFFYDPEGGEINFDTRTGNKATATTGLPISKNNGFYIFRNDGNDYLRIRIKPKLRNAEKVPEGIRMNDEDPYWTLSNLFSIYDVEDIDLPPGAANAASATTKCLKVYFWDSWYQKMITNYLQYSTALSYKANIEGDKHEGKYANPGVIPTGQAIKEIIDLSLSQDGSQQKYTGKAGEAIPSLKIDYSPTVTDTAKWDEGAAKIFFTAPATSNAYDSMLYIYDKHVSSASYNSSSTLFGNTNNSIHDFSLLVKERGPRPIDVGQIALKPMSYFFEKAGSKIDEPGELQTEHYYLQSYNDDAKHKRATKTPRAPTSKRANDKVDLKTLKYHQISNYRFVDISTFTNTNKFCNSPVYSFDFKERSFNVEFKKNSVLTAKEFMTKKYINNIFRNEKADINKLFLITLDEDKKSKNTVPSFSVNGDDPIIRQSDGLQKLLWVGIFQNACINFRTLGLPNRNPGQFIAIDKTDGVDSGAFEDKFFGQWFVINVKHVFETEMYYNDITAIKIHRFDNLPVTFDNILD